MRCNGLKKRNNKLYGPLYGPFCARFLLLRPRADILPVQPLCLVKMMVCILCFHQDLSPYSEQWYELEQLKASVRSLSHAAGLPQSPQALEGNSETVASGLSSGSVSIEALDEIGLEGTSAVPHGEPTQAGRLSCLTSFIVKYSVIIILGLLLSIDVPKNWNCMRLIILH